MDDSGGDGTAHSPAGCTGLRRWGDKRGNRVKCLACSGRGDGGKEAYLDGTLRPDRLGIQELAVSEHGITMRIAGAG